MVQGSNFRYSQFLSNTSLLQNAILVQLIKAAMYHTINSNTNFKSLIKLCTYIEKYIIIFWEVFKKCIVWLSTYWLLKLVVRSVTLYCCCGLVSLLRSMKPIPKTTIPTKWITGVLTRIVLSETNNYWLVSISRFRSREFRFLEMQNVAERLSEE